MNIYKPYFYIIQNIETHKYYAGVRWARGCNPNELLSEGGYTTSSNIVNQIISEKGIDIFIIRKIRTFTSSEAAYNYETKFLNKIQASNNDKFYNMHNNDHIFTYHDSKYKEKMIELYGVDDPNKSQEIVNRIIETNTKNLGVPWPMMSDKCIEKRIVSYIERYGVTNPMRAEDIKEKVKKNNLAKYGVENVYQTDWTKAKIKNTLQEKYGVDHPMHSEDIKMKLKQTNLERYGVENSFQSEIAKNKIKERMLYLTSRPQLDLIRKYKSKYKLKFGQGWIKKSDDYINALLADLKEKYGSL